MRKIKTGIEKLDEELGGGLVQGFNLTIIGEPGSGKSLFAQNLAYSFLQAGHGCVYLITDISPKHLLLEFEEKKIGVNDFLEKGKMVIIDGYSWKTGKKDYEYPSLDSLKDLRNISFRIKRARKQIDAQQVLIVFDILSELFLWSGEREILQFVELQCAKNKVLDDIGLVVLEDGMQSSSALTAIKAITQGTIEMGIDEKDGRWLRVSKMDSTPTTSKKMFFEIVDGKIKMM